MIKQITSKCVAKVWVTSCDCPQSEFVQPSLLFSISDPRKEKAARQLGVRLLNALLIPPHNMVLIQKTVYTKNGFKTSFA